MRILLDHCVDARLGSFFPDHEVSHARDLGWDVLTNGRLLDAAARASFDVLVTTDQNIRFQQNLARLPISVVEINARDTRLPALLPFTSLMAEALERSRRFRFVSVTTDGKFECLAERQTGPPNENGAAAGRGPR